MSAIAHPVDFRRSADAARPPAAAARSASRELALRLVAFFALAAFCAMHYALLVRPVPVARTLTLVAVLTAGGGALALTARLDNRRAAALGLRTGIVLALAVVAFAITGLNARLLLPGHWSSLGDGLHHGLSGLDSFTWPYRGADPWLRLTILLALPALAVPATVLAFWPGRRLAAARSVLALAALLVLYGTGVTELALTGWALRGVALLLLVAAWLWLPRVRAREGLAAASAVLACGLLALPLAASVDGRRPWVDYRNWTLLAPSNADSRSFNWNQTYGPITWPRDTTEVLQVRAPQGHYWKAESLDRFDGIRWAHVDGPFEGDPGEDVVQPRTRAWNEKITFTLRHLRSSVALVAGTPYGVNTDKAISSESDGTVRVLDSPLDQGSTYTVEAYVPDPTAAQLARAPQAYPQRLLGYTYFDLPAPGQTGLHEPATSRPVQDVVGPRTIGPVSAGAPLLRDDVRKVLHSPYARTYRLARSLAAGQTTTYGVVQSVERYFEHGFTYSEHPPARRYPLPAFLFRDRLGYCQQFSGAMTLLLRMNGIPARVAAGFAPGNYDKQLGVYRVRDYDAHSWVEVWFSGIGWVPFDPTPAAAPATAQSAPSAPSAATASSSDKGVSHPSQTDVAPAASGGSRDGVGLWLIVMLGALAVLALAALWVAGVVARRRRRIRRTADAELEELRQALDRLGYSYPARTTLAQLERRLGVSAGPPAAHYVALLGRRRYGPPGASTGPTAADRRALRTALAGSGPLARLRGLLALPPHLSRTA